MFIVVRVGPRDPVAEPGNSFWHGSTVDGAEPAYCRKYFTAVSGLSLAQGPTRLLLLKILRR